MRRLLQSTISYFALALWMALPSAGWTTVASAASHGALSFLPLAPVDLGGPDTRALVSADFDRDGHADLAATLFRDTEDDGLAILFGDGLGGFPRRVSFEAGFRACGLAAGDFNGDGFADLVSTEGTQFKPFPRAPCGEAVSIPVFLNIASSPGSFEWESCLFSGLLPIAAIAGDFNGDSNLDLAVAGNASNDVTVFIGEGGGGFAQGQSTGPLFNRPTSLAAGDWDGDRRLDLAVGHMESYAGRGISILGGNGDGTFTANRPFYSGSAAQAVRAADINGDGFLDLVSADKSGGRVWVCNSSGDGTFRDGLAYPVGTYPNDLALVDLDGDGRPDIVTANSGSDDLSVLIGDGAGGFAPGGTFPAGPEPQGVAVADFSGDGVPDIAVSARDRGEQGSVSILVQQAPIKLLPGDCDGNGSVSIAEVQRSVGFYLGLQPPACWSDWSGDGTVSIGELQKVISGFLGMGMPASSMEQGWCAWGPTRMHRAPIREGR